MLIRPLAAADAGAAVDIVHAAFAAARLAAGQAPDEPTDEHRNRVVRTLRRMVETDTPGCWAADHDDRLIGFATSIRRGTFWGLSQLFVHPDEQSRGVGRHLIGHTLVYADGSERGMIIASEDHRAIRSYATAGFDLHPAVRVEGVVDRSNIPAGLHGRTGGPADADLINAIDERLRGSSRLGDVLFLLDGGADIVVIDDRGGSGYVVHRRGTPLLLGAETVDAARMLLWRAFAAADEEPIQGYAWTGRQRWAVEVAVEACLAVHPSGPLFTRGFADVPEAWLPSGIYF